MKIYFRLLTFCGPIASYLFPYFLFTILGITFGLVNFTLVIPLLNILFSAVSGEAINKMLIQPDFSLSIEYFTKLFNYYFAHFVQTKGKIGALKFVTIFVILSILLSNIFKYLSIRLMETLKLQTVRNMRQAIFEKINHLHLGFFSNHRKGDLIARLTNDVGEVENTISSSFSVFFKEPITLIIYFIALLLLSVKLTIFTLLIIPISGFVISFFIKKLKKDSKEVSNYYGYLMSIIDDSLTGIKISKAFNAENYILNKFIDTNNHFTKITRKLVLRREMASPFSEFTGVLVASFILLYGGSLVLKNESELDASQFVAYIILFSQILRPAKALSSAITGMQRGLASGDRILELLDASVEVTDKIGATQASSFSKSIIFKDVHFSYTKKKIINGLSLEFEYGKMYALVGPSGGGKSTISELLPRFYDPQGGEILFDGKPYEDYTASSLRANMGIVSQESILFNDSIYNNILFGRSQFTKNDVENAAKIANAHEFILKAENGYDTHIGDRGVKLSGGQKQRISIARAVLANPAILILDEATSALDTESEKVVQEALDNLMKNRTSIVVAHRLSTIRNADVIFVIKDGILLDKGTHDELMKNKNGLYYSLATMQENNSNLKES